MKRPRSLSGDTLLSLEFCSASGLGGHAGGVYCETRVSSEPTRSAQPGGEAEFQQIGTL